MGDNFSLYIFCQCIRRWDLVWNQVRRNYGVKYDISYDV